MASQSKFKYYISIAAVLLGLFLVLPNFIKKGENPTGLAKYLPETAMRLGLDLQGGIHMVLGIDLDRAVINEAENMAFDVKKKIEDDKIPNAGFHKDPDGTEFELDFANVQDRKSFESMVTEFFPRLEISRFGLAHFDSNHAIKLDVRDEFLNQIEKDTVDNAVKTLRNRLDQFGVAEPSIAPKGKDKIIVQLPGMEDPDRARAILSKTANLEFQLVSTDVTQVELDGWLSEIYKEVGKDAPLATLQPLLRDKLPENTELIFQEETDATTSEVSRFPYVVSRENRISGENLEDARMGQDTYGMPAVEIRFNSEGAKLFGDLTKAGLQKPLAIVLDDKIMSAPIIQSHITNGISSITFGNQARNQAFEEAKDLALILRSGALPAPIEILENRTVGPSLGKDSIEKGIKAILLGLLLILIFMLVYYRASGFLANMALVINLIFVVACLGMLGATLTLPGIAGILVSIGMSVDANIIIFERIREELSTGRPIKAAIEMGYERAHETILDSNLTTIVTGMILFYFGTGPIKGFAVTLIFGLVANYITALWFTRMGYTWWLGRRERQTLSI